MNSLQTTTRFISATTVAQDMFAQYDARANTAIFERRGSQVLAQYTDSGAVMLTNPVFPHMSTMVANATPMAVIGAVNDMTE